MHPVIAFVGPAGCGKDTAASFLIQERGAVRVSFADPLKRFCRDVFAWPDDLLWGPSELRDAPCPHGRRRADGEPLTPRYALQTLGTEWGRHCYPKVWLEAGLREARELSLTCPVVFTDARFANEMTSIREIGGFLIALERPGAVAREHASERELRDVSPDAIITNDGTPEKLRADVLSLLDRGWLARAG